MGFRTCMVCGEPMADGMTNLEDFYAHEGSCFESLMDEWYPEGWRETDDEGEFGGYYEALYDGKWCDTGVFYTDWEGER